MDDYGISVHLCDFIAGEKELFAFF